LATTVDDVARRAEEEPLVLSRRRRGLTALGIGLVAAAINWLIYELARGSDFRVFHFAAQVWLSGRNPYSIGIPIPRSGGVVVSEPFYYPFPALVAMAPFALLQIRVAAATFVGLSTTLLAYGLLRRTPEKMPAFLGAGFLVAAGMGQWSPLMTALLLFPAISWLAPIKPNIGLATIIARPSRVAVLGSGAFLVATLAFQPTWPVEWLRNLRSLPAHPAPIFVPGGFVVLLALLRWRRPEARLLAAMVCVPQLLYFSDQLPLWLIPERRRESMLLSASSLFAWAASLVFTTRAGLQPAFSSTFYVLAGVYLPALIMVLRRPNLGALPPWAERAAAQLPNWIRGASEAS
jgi:hypothetical protein